MTGTLLIIIGLISLASGIFLFSNSEKSVETKINELQQAIEMAIADGVITENERKIIKQLAVEHGLDFNEAISHAEEQMAALEIDSETELIDFNKRNGDDFEKFIAQKFDKKYYNIKEWAGDKYVNGVYANTTPQPGKTYRQKTADKTRSYAKTAYS